MKINELYVSVKEVTNKHYQLASSGFIFICQGILTDNDDHWYLLKNNVTGKHTMVSCALSLEDAGYHQIKEPTDNHSIVI